jgi:ATP-dependent DNA helicase RecG
MNPAIEQQLRSLRGPLELAAASGFAGVGKIGGLGNALRVACDRTLELLPDHDALRAWRQRLDHFDQMPETERSVEVARGLRLLASLMAAVPAAAPEARRKRSLPAKKSAPAPAEAGNLLGQDPSAIPGIGPAFAAALAERDVRTVEDLLWLLPRRYDDVRSITPLATLEVGDGERAAFRAQVASSRMVYARGRRWLEVRLVDGTRHAVARWFNVRGPMDARFAVGAWVSLSAKIRTRGGNVDVANPDVVAVESDGESAAPLAIWPRYPDIPGLPAARLRTACARASALATAEIDDGVPARVCREQGLPQLHEALHTLHCPAATLSSDEILALNCSTSPWHRRVTFGELFVLSVAVLRRKALYRQEQSHVYQAAIAPELTRAFPFALTGAQQRAITEVSGDLASAAPMNRLLQGDVGSGKTAVLFAAALQVARAGGQTAIMAPTELLAQQHERTLRSWAERVGLRVAMLTASTPRGVRQSLLPLLASGRVDICIGTHSLLSEGLGFASLGLAIIDEQHRFGVAQRIRLRDKGQDFCPHLLVATATPIPRTLALTAYGDLDVTILDELPPGRQPAVTEVLSGVKGRKRATAVVRAALARGARAYVVCPVIDADDEAPAQRRDVETVAAALRGELGDAAVAVVHGRLSSDDRERVMAEFRDGKVSILVATTVVEVGVDIVEATVMMVEEADRFGLAQLHQLRGRVGRGGGAASCLLMTSRQATPEGKLRLEAMARECDGFRIAEIDLEQRGPGEVLGVRQAGIPRLRFGDLREHTELLLQARAAAAQVVAQDPLLQTAELAGLRRALSRRKLIEEVMGASGG